MAEYFGEKTWMEIEQAINDEALIILPIGTTEEHGKHLPVETDAMIARYFGDLLGNACETSQIPALVMQTITYGYSMQAVRKWPGCPNVRTRTFADYVFDIINSLVHMGFRKIVMLDCHGNHDCLLRMVMREIADAHDVFTMTLSPMELSSKVYAQIKKDPKGDIHGGEWETSCILHIHPKLVYPELYTDVDAININEKLKGSVSTWGLQTTKTGLFGNPSSASAELGEAVLTEAVNVGLERIKEFVKL